MTTRGVFPSPPLPTGTLSQPWPWTARNRTSGPTLSPRTQGCSAPPSRLGYVPAGPQQGRGLPVVPFASVVWTEQRPHIETRPPLGRTFARLSHALGPRRGWGGSWLRGCSKTHFLFSSLQTGSYSPFPLEPRSPAAFASSTPQVERGYAKFALNLADCRLSSASLFSAINVSSVIPGPHAPLSLGNWRHKEIRLLRDLSAPRSASFGGGRWDQNSAQRSDSQSHPLPSCAPLDVLLNLSVLWASLLDRAYQVLLRLSGLVHIKEIKQFLIHSVNI